MTDTNKLAELIKKAKIKMWGKTFHGELERNMFVADYLLANGVIVPPVQIGTVVYEIRAKGKGSPRGRYCDYSVTTNYSFKNAIERGLDLYIEQKLFVKTDMTRWNKTVFLTKEEAEEKLKEIRNGTT